MKLSAQQHLEIAIRAAKIAKDALTMLDCSDSYTAKLHLVEVAAGVKNAMDFIAKIQGPTP